jgi:DNA-binding response OmpR family regulator
VLRFDGIEVDFRSHEVRKDGRPIEATRKEIGLLRFLSSRPGEVVRRDALLEAVWGYTADTTTRTVDNHVALLRAKIEVDPKTPRHLVTVHGVGYKWVP